MGKHLTSSKLKLKIRIEVAVVVKEEAVTEVTIKRKIKKLKEMTNKLTCRNSGERRWSPMRGRKKRLVEKRRPPTDSPSQNRCPSANMHGFTFMQDITKSKSKHLPNAVKLPSACSKPHKECQAEQ